VHMPGHIFARLGMWREDIRDNLASVAASKAAEARHQSDGMDQFHSDDFLLYAFLQSGEEARAKTIIDDTAEVMSRYETMPDMSSPFMRSMFPYYRNKFPAFYALEMRDWKAAAALEPASSDRPETKLVTYWARIVAEGHLRLPVQAHADFERHEALVEEVKHGKNAYFVESTGAQITHDELLAWVAFADSDEAEALKRMRQASDLQDRVGQGEVDIPAREMLADMLLELNHPDGALIEYSRALELSPNRFNGLFNAGRAAEAVGDHDKAAAYYSALLESTDNGTHSARQELNHVKAFVSSVKVASK
jgi:tetratricopeptide (TPR) repeat protein